MRKAVIIAVALVAVSCSPKIVERVVYQHDTTQVVRIDSVRYWQKDSVFIREKGDTVFQYVEKVRYRDRFRIDTLKEVREVHDTTFFERKVEKELSVGQKIKSTLLPNYKFYDGKYYTLPYGGGVCGLVSRVQRGGGTRRCEQTAYLLRD